MVDKNDPALSTGADVSELFFKNSFGQGVAPQVLNAFMAVSGLGNIIVMTFTAARVKQEIAKVLTYSVSAHKISTLMSVSHLDLGGHITLA